MEYWEMFQFIILSYCYHYAKEDTLFLFIYFFLEFWHSQSDNLNLINSCMHLTYLKIKITLSYILSWKCWAGSNS
jgi:hypothetical protein